MSSLNKKQSRLLNESLFDGSEKFERLPEGGHFLPVDTLGEVGDAIAAAHKIYDNQKSYVLFIYQNNETNVYDQSIIELYLLEKHGIRAIASTLEDLASDGQTELRSLDKDLYVKGKCISVVYFRSGYAVQDYPSEKCWDLRLKIEISSAIKCPDIFCHLVGMKKFQETFLKPGCLERFIHSKKSISAIKDTSTNFYTLGSAEDVEKAIKLVSDNPKGFVLKPQREGGGNNLFGTSALDFITDKKHQHLLEGYTLMDMINPVESRNHLVSDSTALYTDCVSELGVYGIWLYHRGTVRINKHAGVLVRTKASDTTEGGVCSGGGFLSSLYITPSSKESMEVEKLCRERFEELFSAGNLVL